MPSTLSGPEPAAPGLPSQPSQPSSRWPLALAAALLLAGTLVSLWAWQASASFLARQADDEFERYSELSFHNIGQRMQHQLDLLAGFQALFRASTAVSREEFHHFYTDQRVQVRFPGLLAVQYAQIVAGAERPAFEAAVRADRSITPAGYPDFSIHPPGERAQYLVVTYTEPMQSNEPAFGHDNIADAPHREVVDRARDSGQAQASAPIQLLQQRPGLLVRLPLYRRGMPITTPPERRAAYTGQVSGVLLLADLLRDTLPSRGDAPYQVQVTDQGLIDAASDAAPQPPRLVTRSSSAGTPALWADGNAAPLAQDLRQYTLGVAGRVWAIQVARPAVDHRGAPFPVLLLAGGLSISLLLALLAARLSLLRHRAQGLARVMSRQARANAERLHAVFDSTVDGILTLDRQGTVLSANRAALAIFGHPEARLVGRSVNQLMPLGAAAQISHWLPSAGAAQPPVPGQARTLQARRADRSLFPIELGISEMQVDGQRQYVGLVRDLSQAQAAQARIDAAGQALRAANELREAVFEHAAFALVVMDAQGLIQALNPAAERLLGCRSSEEVGFQALASFLDRADQTTLQAMLQQHRAGDPAASGHSRSIEHTLQLQRRDGDRVPSSVTLSALHDSAGAVSGFLAIAYDITEHQRLAQQLSQLAYHDGLTGLPNRLRLEDHLQQAIALAGRRHEPLALLFIDLDRFKPINDQHGHAVGDQVLCEVARRLQASLRAADLVARLGGDEFVVLLSTLATSDDCLLVADKLMLALAEPMQIGALTLQVGASMGVAHYPESGNTVAELLRSADAAMYQAKQAGRSTQPLMPLLPLRHQRAGSHRTDKPDPLPQA